MQKPRKAGRNAQQKRCNRRQAQKGGAYEQRGGQDGEDQVVNTVLKNPARLFCIYQLQVQLCLSVLVMLRRSES